MSPFIVLTGIVLLIVIGGSLHLIRAGWRGKRIDDHPLCRKCGYDLSGTPQLPDTCPECGARLSRRRAVRIGNRQRRPRMVWLGIWLLVLSIGLGVAYTEAVTRHVEIDWASYKPLWLLRIEARDPDVEVRVRAMNLIQRRTRGGDLSAGQWRALVRDGTAAQADPHSHWDHGWAWTLGDAREFGFIDDTAWTDLLHTAADGALRLEVRPRVAQGDPIPYRLVVDKPRVPMPTTCVLRAELVECRVGGQAAESRAETLDVALRGEPIALRRTELAIDTTMTGDVRPGDHPVELDVAFAIHHPETGQDLRTFTRTFRSRVEVESGTTSATKTTADPTLAGAVERAIQLRAFWALWREEDQAELVITLRYPPVDLAFKVFVVTPAGERIEFGEVAVAAGDWDSYRLSRTFDEQLVGPVSVVFEPSEDVADATLDVFEYWGEPVQFDGVTVKPLR